MCSIVLTVSCFLMHMQYWWCSWRWCLCCAGARSPLSTGLYGTWCFVIVWAICNESIVLVITYVNLSWCYDQMEIVWTMCFVIVWTMCNGTMCFMIVWTMCNDFVTWLWMFYMEICWDVYGCSDFVRLLVYMLLNIESGILFAGMVQKTNKKEKPGKLSRRPCRRPSSLPCNRRAPRIVHVEAKPTALPSA
jgi:hypothetical protein